MDSGELMFDDITDKIIGRIKNKCNIETSELEKIKQILDEEVSPLKIICDEKLEIITFNTEDFHLIQFPAPGRTLPSLSSMLKNLSHELNNGLPCKRIFIFAYTDEKMTVEAIEKDKAYIFKVHAGNMTKVQMHSTLDYYNKDIGAKINEFGYNIIFVADEFHK